MDSRCIIDEERYNKAASNNFRMIYKAYTFIKKVKNFSHYAISMIYRAKTEIHDAPRRPNILFLKTVLHLLLNYRQAWGTSSRDTRASPLAEKSQQKL